MCSNTCVFLVVLGLKVGSTDVFKATLEVCEPWSGIKRYGDSDSLAHPVQKSVRKLMRNKTWGKADNDSGGLWHQILPHSSGCYCQPHFPDDKTESSRSQVTGQTPLSSQGAGSSVLAPDSSPPPVAPRVAGGALGQHRPRQLIGSQWAGPDHTWMNPQMEYLSILWETKD